MNKDQAYEYIKNTIEIDDNLIGFFIAQKPFSLLWFFIIGPLAVLTMKTYYVAVSKQGAYFYRLNLMGKPANVDFMSFDEIESIKIGKGMLQRPMLYRFKNGKKLKLKAQLKGAKNVAVLTPHAQAHLERNIQVI